MCVFCKIANKEIPADIVYEDEKYMAFKDINPKAPIHILIIPKEHIEKLADINDTNKGIIGDMTVVANKVAKQLGIDKTGYRIVINNGPDAGQEVYHIHMHLLGGKKLLFAT